MSWTSKWRIPSVRFIASRVIAKTSGSDVVEGLLDPLVLALAALLGELAAALEVRVVELVLGRLVRLGELADLLADLGELRADLRRRRAPRTRLRARWPRRPSAGCVGPRGRSSRRNGKGIAWTVSIAVDDRPERPVWRGLAPEAGPVADDEEHERQRRRGPARTGPPSNRRGRVHLGFLRSGSAPAAQADAPARRAQLVAASRGRDRARLEAALAVGSVELEAHRSPGCGGRRGRLLKAPVVGRVVAAPSSPGSSARRAVARRPPRGASPG